MLLLMIIAAGVLHSQAAFLMNTTGSLDELGVCHCSVILPNATFPTDRLEVLEISHRDLNISVNKEITKIRSYQATLTGYLQKLKNLTRRVEVVEMRGVSYTELDFDLLKLEIREMESLAMKLSESLNGSNVLVKALLVEIHNISVMVNQLESYDKNNILAVRREMASLRKRLEECKKQQARPTPPVINYGSCDHRGLVNISKPFLVLPHWLGYYYKFGGWGKDTFSGANQDVYWVAPLMPDSRMMNILRFYPSYDDILLHKSPTVKILSKTLSSKTNDSSLCGQGGGMIMFNNSMYYNCFNSRDICKFNVNTSGVERKTLTDSAFNNVFSYASSKWQDIDLASDENGLWVIYSTEMNSGNIVISKLNPLSLTVEKTWSTSQYKPGVTNAFMICGVLYATRALNTRREEIFYKFDTNTGKEEQLSITFDKMQENVQSMSYNPNDHKLYVYNDRYQVSYDLFFKPTLNYA